MNAGESTFCSFIDLEKAFDWLNRDLLLWKLLANDIDGKMYFAIRSLLNNTLSSIKLANNVSTAYFNVTSGVKQGDPLSPTLFSLFINDLVSELKTSGLTLNIDNYEINSLLYADDMVLLAKNEGDLQILLLILNG